MPAMNMKEKHPQGWLGKDMKPGYDYTDSRTGKLPGPDNSMKKSYPKTGSEKKDGFPPSQAYDHTLIKTYPKSKVKGEY